MLSNISYNCKLYYLQVIVPHAISIAITKAFAMHLCNARQKIGTRPGGALAPQAMENHGLVVPDDYESLAPTPPQPMTLDPLYPKIYH